MKFKALAVLSLCAVAACGKAPDATKSDPSTEKIVAPAGEYRLDPSHSSLVFQVNHIGFSWYTASFSDFDATLQFDPEDPETMSVTAAINVPSLTIPSPPEGFHAELMGADWFNAGAFPEIVFRSTKVTPTGDRTATVEGELTLLGSTAPVTMEAKFIGGYAGYPPYDPNARIGFSAHGTLNRSDFGFTYGLPPEGSTMGVGDAVSFEFNGEFSGPPAPAAEGQ